MLARYYRCSIVNDCFNQIVPNGYLENRNRTTKEIVFVDEDNGFVVGQIRPMPSEEELQKYKGLINGYIEKAKNAPIEPIFGGDKATDQTRGIEALQEEIERLKAELVSESNKNKELQEEVVWQRGYIEALKSTLREYAKTTI